MSSLSLIRSKKFADFLRYLPRFLAVLCHVNVYFSRVHDHLSLKPFADFTKFAISPKSFRFTCHFGISMSVQLSMSSRKSRRSSLSKGYVILRFELYS